MSYIGFACVVTRKNRKEKIPALSCKERALHWFRTDGTPFPEEHIGMPCARSHFAALNVASGGLLCKIIDPGEDMMVRLNTKKVSTLIEKMEQYVKETAPNPSDERIGDVCCVTVHNMIKTFQIMIEKYGDNARFYLI